LDRLGWATGFNRFLVGQKAFRDLKITDVPEVEIPESSEEAIEKIFATQPRRRPEIPGQAMPGYEGVRADMDKVSQMVFTWANRHPEDSLFLDAVCRTTARKAGEIHDVKFVSAMIETHRLASPCWRPHLLSAMTHFLHSSNSDDNTAVVEAREQLKKTGPTIALPSENSNPK
jgi:hypothetical protein